MPSRRHVAARRATVLLVLATSAEIAACGPDQTEMQGSQPPIDSRRLRRDRLSEMPGAPDVCRPTVPVACPEGTGGPYPTPFTVAPVLENEEELAAAIRREYSPLMRDAEVSGIARVWVEIDERGGVRDTQLDRSSGQPGIDEAALRVARTLEFSPARNGDEIVPVWVSVPIVFALDSTGAR